MIISHETLRKKIISGWKWICFIPFLNCLQKLFHFYIDAQFWQSKIFAKNIPWVLQIRITSEISVYILYSSVFPHISSSDSFKIITNFPKPLFPLKIYFNWYFPFFLTSYSLLYLNTAYKLLINTPKTDARKRFSYLQTGVTFLFAHRNFIEFFSFHSAY